MFVDNSVILYGIQTYLLTDKGTQFVSKLLAAVTRRLGTKHLKMITYYPQINGQVERINRTSFTRFQHYEAEQQTYWDQYLLQLTYSFNAQVHRLTGTSPFCVVLCRQPTGPTIPNPPSAIKDDMTEPSQWQNFRSRFLHHLDVLHKQMDANSHLARHAPSATSTELSETRSNLTLDNRS